MIKETKINSDNLKTIVESDKFTIEEIGNVETGEIHNDMFIDGFMTVDEIIYAVKKYSVQTVWYGVGTDKTHTFPLVIKLRDSIEENDKFGDVEFSFPKVHKMFFNGEEWRYVYNYSI